MQQRTVQQFLSPQPRIVNGKPTQKSALGASLILGGVNIASQWLQTMWQNRQNNRVAEEQNAYNERMIDKQNEYNSPDQQIARLMEAGYTRSQAMSMLFSTPSSAVGTQSTAPVATDMTGKYAVPQLDTPMSAVDSFVGAGKTIEETNNLFQDEIAKKIANKYMEQNALQSLGLLVKANRKQDIENEMSSIQLRISSQTEDATTQAMMSELARSIVINSPFTALSVGEQSKYINLGIKKLLQGEENEVKLGKFMQSQYDFMLEHVDLYNASNSAKLKQPIEDFRHSRSFNRLSERSLGLDVGKKGIEFDFFKSHKEQFALMWESANNENIARSVLNSDKDTYTKMVLDEYAPLYMLGIKAQWDSDASRNQYDAQLYQFLSTNLGQDVTRWTNTFTNLMNVINATRGAGVGAPVREAFGNASLLKKLVPKLSF